MNRHLKYSSGWALIQIPDFLLFVYRGVRKALKVNDYAKVCPGLTSQKMSKRLDKSIVSHMKR